MNVFFYPGLAADDLAEPGGHRQRPDLHLVRPRGRYPHLLRVLGVFCGGGVARAARQVDVGDQGQDGAEDEVKARSIVI